MKKILVLIGAIALGAGVLGACAGNTTPSAASNAAQAEQTASGDALQNLLRSQPIPERPWSQLRQNLIELETAQMDTTQTTSFMFNQGVQDPVQSCPSVGFPIAATSELTNPTQIIQDRGDRNGGNVTIPQIDPNGVYAGNSTGTYVICLDAQGRAYADYFEGFVQTVTGPAKWNTMTHTVDLVGPPSFKFSSAKK